MGILFDVVHVLNLGFVIYKETTICKYWFIICYKCLMGSYWVAFDTMSLQRPFFSNGFLPQLLNRFSLLLSK